MTNPFIDLLISNGELSPAARDMDPRDAVEQHAEAHALNFAEKASLFERADISWLGPVEALVEGDLVDLESLLVTWGARDESYDADLMAAQSELGTVEDVRSNADGSVTIYTDLMNLAVPASTQVEYRPTLENRCAECGNDSTNGDGFDGLCGNCADRAVSRQDG